MRRGLAVACGVVGLAISSLPAWPWEDTGHQVVGKVADILLERDTATRDRVNELMKGTSLSDAALWADCAKGACDRDLTREEKRYVRDNPRHHEFHYTDVPFQESRYRGAAAAGAGHDDVVQVITYAVQQLRDTAPSKGPAVLNDRKAVWLLAHLVGDIHQPLHVGAIYFNKTCKNVVNPQVDGAGKPKFGIGKTFGHTTGGNDLHLVSGGSLHHYWDQTAVDAAMQAANKGTIKEFAQFLVDNPPANWITDDDVETWSVQWATEALPLARQALTQLGFDDGKPEKDKDHLLKCSMTTRLNAGYDPWAATVVRDQLAKAGFRLAALLRAALAD